MGYSNANLGRVLRRHPPPAAMNPGGRRPDPWFSTPLPVVWKSPTRLMIEATLITVSFMALVIGAAFAFG